jgi:hypothetical protein
VVCVISGSSNYCFLSLLQVDHDAKYLSLECDHKSYHILLLYQPTLLHIDYLRRLEKFMIFLPPLQEDVSDLFVL